jgi:hypothetical protein
MASAGLIAYATLPSKAGAVTLLDFAKSLDPNGSIARVIEMLTQSNEMLQDMRWIEGNLPTGHRSTIRTGLPTPIWRQLYQGVPPSKSTRAQVDDACGMLEARSEVDKDLALLNNDVGAFRLSEAQAFLEAMNQAMAETLIYGNSAVNPERFTGLAARYSSLSAGNGANIIDGGGTGTDNTSVWLVVWGENTITGIYPKGSQAGLDAAGPGRDRRVRRQQQPLPRAGRALPVEGRPGAARLALRGARRQHRRVRPGRPDRHAGQHRGHRGDEADDQGHRAHPVHGHGHAGLLRRPHGQGNAGHRRPGQVAEALSIEPAVQQFGQVTPGFTGNGTMRFLGVPVRTCDRILETEARVV